MVTVNNANWDRNIHLVTKSKVVYTMITADSNTEEIFEELTRLGVAAIKDYTGNLTYDDGVYILTHLTWLVTEVLSHILHIREERKWCEHCYEYVKTHDGYCKQCHKKLEEEEDGTAEENV